MVFVKRLQHQNRLGERHLACAKNPTVRDAAEETGDMQG